MYGIYSYAIYTNWHRGLCTLVLFITELHFTCLYSKTVPETSTPEPVSAPPPPLSDLTSDLTSELYPLHSGEQLPMGLLGDDTPSELHVHVHVHVHTVHIQMYVMRRLCFTIKCMIHQCYV